MSSDIISRQIKSPQSGGGIPTTAQVVTVDNETSTAPNSRQLVNGLNTTVDTSTDGQIKLNLAGTGILGQVLQSLGDTTASYVNSLLTQTTVQQTIPINSWTNSPSDLGKWLIFTFPGAVTLTFDGTAVVTNGVFALYASSATTVNVVATNGATIEGNTTLNPGDVYLVLLIGETTYKMIPLNAPTTSPVLLATVSGVNLNQTSKVPLFTVPAGKRLVVTYVLVRDATIPITTANASLGFLTANDWVGVQPLNGLTGNTKSVPFLPAPGSVIGVAGEIFGITPGIAQGSPATCTVDVFGYYR